MTLFKTILVYLLAYILVAGTEVLTFPFSFVYRLPAFQRKPAKLAFQFTACTAAALCVVFIVALVARLLNVTVSIFMIGIPLVLAVLNDAGRIRKAMSGTSLVTLFAGPDYDQPFHVKQEYAAAIGSFIGFVLGMNLFMRDALFSH